MNYWIDLSYILLCGYCTLILAYFFGWINIKNFKKPDNINPLNRFSILIPARNEAGGIINCLQSITSQNYPALFFEVIILNDRSGDNTLQLVNDYVGKNPMFSIRAVNLADHIPKEGKKEAITYGVSIALHPYIILTDADCTRQPQWLASIDAFIQKNNAKMIYAPVIFTSGSMFERLQSLEFAGLVGIGAAAIRLRNPNMCSAANLVFETSVFEEVNGYEDNANLASGDDEFLLHKVFKKYPGSVYFLKNYEAIVRTSPNGTLEQLAQQRRRWVSKSTKYDNRYITAILVGAYLFNFSILFNIIYGFFDPQYLAVGLIQLLIKTIVEGLFLFTVLHFFQHEPVYLELCAMRPSFVAM